MRYPWLRHFEPKDPFPRESVQRILQSLRSISVFYLLQCGFDGGDCLQTTQSITRETLAVIIPTFYTQQQISKLSRHISVLISTLVNQNADPEPWSATENDGIHVTYLNPVVFQIAQSNL